MKTTSDLIKEHDGILLMLSIMSKIADNIQHGGTADIQDLEKIIEFLRVFADKCHHGKEESVLFPELERLGIPRDGGPIGVMLLEHQIGRGIIANLHEAFVRYQSGENAALADIAEALGRYTALLENHIQKENHILFPMADRVLTSPLDDELYEKYEKIEEEVIGHGRHEEFHRLLKQLKESYLAQS